MFSKTGGFGGKRIPNTSSWKGKDGEDSATVLQGTGTGMVGEEGRGSPDTKGLRGGCVRAGKKQAGNVEEQIPKEDFCSKAAIHQRQQNEAK